MPSRRLPLDTTRNESCTQVNRLLLSGQQRLQPIYDYCFSIFQSLKMIFFFLGYSLFKSNSQMKRFKGTTFRHLITLQIYFLFLVKYILIRLLAWKLSKQIHSNAATWYTLTIQNTITTTLFRSPVMLPKVIHPWLQTDSTQVQTCARKLGCGKLQTKNHIP